MSLLSDAEVAAIRARHPNRTARKRKMVEPVLTTKVLRAFTARAIKAVNNQLKRSPVFRSKPRKEANVCPHWCPVGRHEWQHVIKDPGSRLDAWELVCPECSK